MQLGCNLVSRGVSKIFDIIEIFCQRVLRVESEGECLLFVISEL